MTLLFADGFDGFTAGGNRTVLDPVYDYAGVVGTTSAGVLASGRGGDKCAFADIGFVQLGVVYGHELIVSSLSASTTWIIGFAYCLDDNNFHKGTTKRLPILQFLDSAGDGMTSFYIGGNNVNAVSGEINSTTKIGLGSAGLYTKLWHYIEIKVTFSTSSGAVEIRVDGQTALSASGVTAPTLTFETAPTKVILGPSNTSVRVLIDDVYICDSAGSINNDFLGDVGVRRLDPSADGTTNQFTPLGGGSNYVEVDEDDPDGDATYNESSTIGHKDLYAFENSPSAPTTINALQVVSTGKSDDGGAKGGRNRIRSSTAEEPGDTYALISTYVPYQSIHETDPNTAAAWTEAGINAAEIGVEVVS